LAAQAQPEPGEEALAAAYASADLLLTLVTLDPSLGAEHLATWAADAVVVVTAGRSSWERLHGVGEMVRLAGTRLVSAVLIGADNTDESLGTPQAPSPPPALPVRADNNGRSLRTPQASSLQASASPDFLLADSPAPTHHSGTSRPSRGLRRRAQASEHDNPLS
jgi:hypothetical protein